MTNRLGLIICFLALVNSIYGQTLQDKWISCNNEGCQLLDPYFSDGVTVKWDGKCTNGKADGFGKLLKYKNGEYESTYEGEYKNGIREGKGKFSHQDGTITSGTFINGQLIGYGTRTDDDGNKYEGEFLNYRQHGQGNKHYANGAVFDGFWVSGRPYTGKFTDYDGTISYIQEYESVKSINEKKTGYRPQIGVRVTEYFDDNWNRCKPKNASYYRLVTYKEHNKPLGTIRDYYIEGQLQSEFTAIYLDYDDEGKNFHEGEAIWYHKNGNVEQKRYYYNNIINGPNTFYFENGQIAQERNYKRGRLDGVLQSYYPAGKPRIVAVYEDGELYEQKFIEFDENGMGMLVYNENFYRNEDKWTSKSENYESNVNEDGYVQLTLENNGGVQNTNYISFDANSDYSIEAIIEKNKGSTSHGYGLIFGFKDWNNYFQFLISDIGSYSILSRFEGIDLQIADWTESNAINIDGKSNYLKILKFEDTFYFSINGTVVEQDESKLLRGNYYGLYASGKGKYTLKQLLLKEFLSSQASAAISESSSNSNDDWNGNGSGLIISKNGHIITNQHVIENANEIEVEVKYKNQIKVFKAELKISDKVNDLAIIQILDDEYSNTGQIPFNISARSSDVGTSVFALGYPMALSIMGKEVKFTDGKISSKTGYQGDITTYQTTVPLQPGNSGGPLFDNQGNLIGINTSSIDKSYADNVGYAVKSNYVLNLIDVLPESIMVPSSNELSSKPLTSQIKTLSDYVVLVKVK